MSQALHRMGRFAARRPWVVIGSWLLAAVVVIVASSAFGRELGDSVEVPGLDSHKPPSCSRPLGRTGPV